MKRERLSPETHRRRASEAKRMAREHALHASAHLAAGNLGAAANQFHCAGDYASVAHREERAAIDAESRP